MAAECLGSIGAYRIEKYLREREERERERNGGLPTETVWVTKRYIPTDLRVTAPVTRHKLLVSSTLPHSESHWIPLGDPPLRSFERNEEKMAYASHPSTRSEDWSTLRQTLPSRGSHKKVSPPNWGTGLGLPPIVIDRAGRRFPKVNSAMTRYVDDMHVTNRMFSLH